MIHPLVLLKLKSIRVIIPKKTQVGLEVELTKFFNLEKYEELYYSRAWKEVFPIFPNIVVVSDKKVKTNNEFNIINIDTEFKNVE